MTSPGNASVTRRLAAIVIADVVGYSRLMERDDMGTFARLRSIRDEIVDPAIVSHGGRIVKTAGDGFLADFPSALAALRASVQIQREMAKRNEGLVVDERIDYRIGVNLGDVMADKDDIAGDGVNVASRLESLAEPGGICVSGSVREQVHGQMAVAFDDIGDQQVKNIARPIRVYAVTLTPEPRDIPGRGLAPGARLAAWWRRRRSRRPIALAVLVTAVALAVGVAWWRVRSVPEPGAPEFSVGIVPLAGAAESPASSAMRESLTRDVATQLSRASAVLRIVPVAASIAEKPLPIRDRIRVRYVLEGDVRQAGGAAEIRLRLVEAQSGEQRWSETIALKDPTEASEAKRAVRAVMGHAADRLFELETQRATAIAESAATPAELALRAYALLETGTSTSLDTVRKMESLCETALRRDAELLLALRCIVAALDGQLDLDSNADRTRIIARMDQVTAKAVNLNRSSSRDWEFRSGVLMYLGRWDAALEASARAVELDPDGAHPLAGLAWTMTMVGRPDEAVRIAHEAIAKDPPGGWWVVRAECEALLLMGRYPDAVAACERAAGRSGADFDIAYFLAAAYAQLGNTRKAAEEAKKILRAAPGFTIAALRAKQYSTHPEYMRLAEEHWYSGLRKAGIPEK